MCLSAVGVFIYTVFYDQGSKIGSYRLYTHTLLNILSTCIPVVVFIELIENGVEQQKRSLSMLLLINENTFKVQIKLKALA